MAQRVVISFYFIFFLLIYDSPAKLFAMPKSSQSFLKTQFNLEVFTCLKMLWSCESFLESWLNICRRSLCFLRASWHGAKNSCLRTSSALILSLGFTVKHLSTRSKSDSGIFLKKAGLLVCTSHQFRSFTDAKNSALYRSCHNIQ